MYCDPTSDQFLDDAQKTVVAGGLYSRTGHGPVGAQRGHAGAGLYSASDHRRVDTHTMHVAGGPTPTATK